MSIRPKDRSFVIFCFFVFYSFIILLLHIVCWHVSIGMIITYANSAHLFIYYNFSFIFLVQSTQVWWFFVNFFFLFLSVAIVSLRKNTNYRFIVAHCNINNKYSHIIYFNLEWSLIIWKRILLHFSLFLRIAPISDSTIVLSSLLIYYSEKMTIKSRK